MQNSQLEKRKTSTMSTLICRRNKCIIRWKEFHVPWLEELLLWKCPYNNCKFKIILIIIPISFSYKYIKDIKTDTESEMIQHSQSSPKWNRQIWMYLLTWFPLIIQSLINKIILILPQKFKDQHSRRSLVINPYNGR